MCPSFAADDTAVAPIIGVTLFVALSVIVMSIIGLAVFQFDVLTETPEADLVFEEAGTDEVIVGVEWINTDDLSKNDVELSVRGDDCSETWDGSGTLAQGDTNVFDQECSFENGDVLQVIGRNAVLDTYEASNQS